MKKKTATSMNKFTPWVYGLIIFLLGAILGKYSFITQEQTIVTSEARTLTDFVDSAADLVETQGEAAYSQFRMPDSAWWNDDAYIFVYDMNGTTLVLPPTPEVEGTNRLSLADSNGVRFVNEMVQQLKSKDIAWVQYSYPRPGETEASVKLSYVRKVKLPSGRYVFIGSGFYY